MPIFGVDVSSICPKVLVIFLYTVNTAARDSIVAMPSARDNAGWAIRAN